MQSPLCQKFLKNPNLNPNDDSPIDDGDFEYFYGLCKSLDYIPNDKILKLLYGNKYYGMKVCRQFIKNNTINPVTGERISKVSEDYHNLMDLCDYYNFDISSVISYKSHKPSSPKIKTELGSPPKTSELLPMSETEYTSEILPIPNRMSSQSKLSPNPNRMSSQSKLSPIPNSMSSQSKLSLIPNRMTSQSKLLPIPNRMSSQSKLLPIPKREFSRIPKKAEDENILTNLKKIALNLHKNEDLKREVFRSLPVILRKNADYDKKSNTILLSGDKKKYGIKQFIFDLLIDDEIELVMKIIEFFDLKYIDIAEYLLDFPNYAMNESLIINYFINAPIDTDWSVLEMLFDDIYSNWILEEKLNLLILFTGSAVVVGNDFLLDILSIISNNWRKGIQQEIDEMEEEAEEEEKDKIINLVETLDMVLIR